MDFVLALHSHLPWVLHHGRWPHGSDWLCEAAVDTYLPLLIALERAEGDGVPTPVTLGITPVLAAQLAHPSFGVELDDFLAQRIASCDAAPTSLAVTGDQALVPLAAWWRERYVTLRDRFHAADRDLIAAFRALERRGRIEIISSAATHGFLPLLGRDESIRFQLAAGKGEHRRHFGRPATGCWLPECAYRPSGPWAPAGARPAQWRRGTHEHLAAAGYRYFFVDAHLAHAGTFLGQYHEVPLGAERFDAERHDPDTVAQPEAAERSPYRAVRLPGQRLLAAMIRDPKSSMQVWSRKQGYPGDPWYLEFHKIRWPGGLKLWRVTGGDCDLGDKTAYDPARARERAAAHAEHFAGVLAGTAAAEKSGRVIVAPFDTELFGHWWFEGVDFIADLFRRLSRGPVRPVTAGDHVGRRAPRSVVQLAEGSWGANGDFSMWLNPETAWTWQRMWPLEDRFWGVARGALTAPATRHVLAQASRSLLLAQASDWQFIISTGAAADYAEKRFREHCGDAERLLTALEPGAAPGALEAAANEADALRPRDDCFPDVLDAVSEALA